MAWFVADDIRCLVTGDQKKAHLWNTANEIGAKGKLFSWVCQRKVLLCIRPVGCESLCSLGCGHGHVTSRSTLAALTLEIYQLCVISPFKKHLVIWGPKVSSLFLSCMSRDWQVLCFAFSSKVPVALVCVHTCVCAFAGGANEGTVEKWLTFLFSPYKTRFCAVHLGWLNIFFFPWKQKLVCGGWLDLHVPGITLKCWGYDTFRQVQEVNVTFSAVGN